MLNIEKIMSGSTLDKHTTELIRTSFQLLTLNWYAILTGWSAFMSRLMLIRVLNGAL